MNPMNLYITTCRMVLQSTAEDDSSWTDISRLLPCLRQSLICCVCSKILNVPTTSSVSTCNHNICKSCIGGKFRLKPSCNRCNDHSKFVENAPLKILLQCYKKLCEYIMNSGCHRRLGNLNGGSTTSFAELVQEGAELNADYNPPANQTVSISNLRNSIMNVCSRTGVKCELDTDSNADLNCAYTNGNSTPYSTKDCESSKSSSRKRESENKSESNSKQTDSSDSVNHPVLRDMGLPFEVSNFRPKRKNCRCGVATPNPGKLTCCGQRCPCYVDQRACVQCRCRGCRNPNKAQNKNVHYQGIQLDDQETAEVDFYVENMVDTNGDIAA